MRYAVDEFVSGILKVVESTRECLIDKVSNQLHNMHSRIAMLTEWQTIALTLPRRTGNSEIALRLLHQIEGSWLVVRDMLMARNMRNGASMPGDAKRMFGVVTLKNRISGSVLPSTLISDAALQDEKLFDLVVEQPWPRDFIWIRLGEQLSLAPKKEKV